MQKIVVWIFVLLVLGGLVYLVQATDVSWQSLSIAVAALAAPAKLIAGLFTDEDGNPDKDKLAELEKMVAELKAKSGGAA